MVSNCTPSGGRPHGRPTGSLARPCVAGSLRGARAALAAHWSGAPWVSVGSPWGLRGARAPPWRRIGLARPWVALRMGGVWAAHRRGKDGGNPAQQATQRRKYLRHQKPTTDANGTRAARCAQRGRDCVPQGLRVVPECVRVRFRFLGCRLQAAKLCCLLVVRWGCECVSGAGAALCAPIVPRKWTRGCKQCPRALTHSHP